MFFCVAEGHVEDGDLEEATVASDGCLEIFREEGDEKGGAQGLYYNMIYILTCI